MPSHIKVNVVRKGRCWLRVEGQAPVDLTVGDCVVVAGSPFILSSDPDGPTVSARDVFASDGMAAMVGKGEDFSILGGSVEVGPCGRRAADRGPATSDDDQGSRRLLDRLAAGRTGPGVEQRGAGARLMSNDLLTPDLRARAAPPPDVVRCPSKSWLSALADPHVARALQALHGDPARRWTVADLAHEAGQSRSAFAARFKSAACEAPLEYLTGWRCGWPQRSSGRRVPPFRRSPNMSDTRPTAP